MGRLPSSTALSNRLDTALTAELIMVPSALLRLTDQHEAAGVAHEMTETTYDVLPCDRSVSSYWVRADLLEFGFPHEPIHRSLAAQDLVAASTPVPRILALMVSFRRGFYFVLDGAQLVGLLDFVT